MLFTGSVVQMVPISLNKVGLIVKRVLEVAYKIDEGTSNTVAAFVYITLTDSFTQMDNGCAFPNDVDVCLHGSLECSLDRH